MRKKLQILLLFVFIIFPSFAYPKQVANPYPTIPLDIFDNESHYTTHPPITQPKAPKAQMPQTTNTTNISTKSAQETNTHIPLTQNTHETQGAPSKILQNLITDSIQKNMLLRSACIDLQTASQNNLTSAQVEQFGNMLELSTQQYKDNLLRLQTLTLSPANADLQKRFFTAQKGELRNAFMVLSFMQSGIKRHTIALSPELLQIDNAFFANNAQIFSLFQTYFCPIQTRQKQNPQLNIQQILPQSLQQGLQQNLLQNLPQNLPQDLQQIQIQNLQQRLDQIPFDTLEQTPNDGLQF